MPNAGDVVGRFVLQAELGRGPLSQVFLALERDTMWKAALKFFLLEPGSRAEDAAPWTARMIREARALAAFRHDNVVAIHDVGEMGGAPYLVRDFIEGRSLAEVASDRGPGTHEWKTYWLRETARVLGDIHRAGLLHREVKPGNFLVRRDGALRLLDFGVARRVIDRAPGIDAPISERLGVPSSNRLRTFGTPSYTAPERFANQPASPASDQFGWGVVAYEVFAGALPWGEKAGMVKTIDAILTRDPPPLRGAAPDVPHAVEAVVRRALAKTPGARFPSMDDLLRAFDAALPTAAPRA